VLVQALRLDHPARRYLELAVPGDDRGVLGVDAAFVDVGVEAGLGEQD
jgi:hypothetical protein